MTSIESETDAVIVQAILNEFVSRQDSPRVPLSPREVGADIVEVLGAGAGIVHFHPRDDSGAANGWRPQDDVSYYREALETARANLAPDVRERFLWIPPQGEAGSASVRWRHVEPLTIDPGLELITVDPGALDMFEHDPVARTVKALPPSFGSKSSEAEAVDTMSAGEQWIWFCHEAQRLGIRIIFGVLEPGFLRRILALYDAGLIPDPLWLHFHVTDKYSFGLPAEPETYATYRRMIPSDVKAEWFCSYIGVTAANQDRLTKYTLDEGGHVRAGVGSPPLEGLPQGKTNRDAVEEVVELAISRGRRVADAEMSRNLLGLSESTAPV